MDNDKGTKKTSRGLTRPFDTDRHLQTLSTDLHTTSKRPSRTLHLKHQDFVNTFEPNDRGEVNIPTENLLPLRPPGAEFVNDRVNHYIESWRGHSFIIKPEVSRNDDKAIAVWNYQHNKFLQRSAAVNSSPM